MHHKRKKAKYARGYRAGMGMVKPWKMNGTSPEAVGSEKFSDHKRRLDAEFDTAPMRARFKALARQMTEREIYADTER